LSSLLDAVQGAIDAGTFASEADVALAAATDVPDDLR
jgi:hypothetical protein